MNSSYREPLYTTETCGSFWIDMWKQGAWMIEDSCNSVKLFKKSSVKLLKEIKLPCNTKKGSVLGCIECCAIPFPKIWFHIHNHG